ncbi:MAG: glycosyltransferase family protein [bacterium]
MNFILSVFFFVLSFFSQLVANQYLNGFSKTWTVGGDISINFSSNTNFNYNSNNLVRLVGHLPGIQEISNLNKEAFININHVHTLDESLRLVQDENSNDLILYSSWKNNLPEDFVHLMYGVSRYNWIKNKIFTVHAACIGDDDLGYILLVGPSGSGKTSMVLHNAIKNGLKVFSADKTLVRFDEKGNLFAIAGTPTITLRHHDTKRWPFIKKINESIFGDRVIFTLPQEYYSDLDSVPIKKIFLIRFNENSNLDFNLSNLSALHELYPFFLDKQREDVLLSGYQDLFDGNISKKIKKYVAENLSKVLKNVPTYKISGSTANMSSIINKHLYSDYSKKKILFGICGIGSGHYNRQLPLMKHFLEQGHNIIIFTYGEILNRAKKDLNKYSNISIISVANPYFVGTPDGLSFEQTLFHENNNLNFFNINTSALYTVAKEFDNLDLVISDYEMVAAMYAYSKQIPLITLDQQSKFLVGDFPKKINGCTCLDEIERLNLFFPKAAKRFAISFFNVEQEDNNENYNVEILPPVIRENLIEAKSQNIPKKDSLLVYFTGQQMNYKLSFDKWLEVLKKTLPSNFKVHIFLPKSFSLPNLNKTNLYFYHHGNQKFDSILTSCKGIISTAGHTLLSEAMFLQIPVYAIPLPLYEQQLNAYVIAQGKFGISESDLTEDGLLEFINNLSFYTKNIREDKVYLVKGFGNNIIVEKFNQLLRGI